VSLDLLPVVDELAKTRREPGAMKLATMTLAIFFGSGEGADWVRSRAHALAEKHPARVLVFDANRKENEHSIEPPRARSEWVEIGVQGASAYELDAALTQLQLPDAPVVFLWIAESLASDDRFLTLARRSDTTICSTSVARTDELPLRDLCAFVEAHPETPIQDVAYVRLVAWQELIAEFFDNPDRRNELASLREIEVTAGSDAEMYYLLGWIASRLDWNVLDGETFGTHDGKVHFSMIHDGPPRRLSKVTLGSTGASFSASIHPDDPNAVVLETTGSATATTRYAPLHTVDLASLVERAILTHGFDPVFNESLTMAKHIIEKRIA
jgi:glucose-6-phosphate dehydrogenase assembly protein OpcA